MAENITLNNVATFQNDTSAVNTINNNNTAIVNAFADVLSRSGSPPNQMTSSLDMNNNQIINLPPPTTANSPLRLIDAAGGAQFSIVTATTGTSGHVVPFLDGSNTWSALQTIIPPSGTSQGLVINQTLTGNFVANLSANSISIADTLNAGAFSVNGLLVNQTLGSTAVLGNRNSLVGQLVLNSPTNAGNSNRNYNALIGQVFANSSDNGTGVTSGTGAGAFVGGNFTANTSGSATNLLVVAGASISTTMSAGSSTWAKAGLQIFGTGSDAVAGSGINTMIWLANQTSAVKWNYGILIDTFGGLGAFPISASGTILKTGAGSCTTGIDLSSTTFSSVAILTPGFSVNNIGQIATGVAGISSGAVQFSGITSGNVNINVDATSTGLGISKGLTLGTTGSVGGSVTILGQTSGSASLTCSATGSTLQLGSGNVAIDTSGVIGTNGSIRVGSSTAPIAGGDTSHAYFMSTVSAFAIYYGSGAPTITAAQGSLYLNTTGATNVTRAYINTTGSNVWTAINTVA